MKTGALILAVGLLPAVAATPASAAAQTAPTAAAQQQGAIDPEYSCVVCHTDKRRSFLLGAHSERGIRCDDCHGGNPRGFEVADAHTGPDYIGAPDKLETVELCSSCHSDPDQMRQYGLPAGELAEYRTSKHGELLLKDGDFDAPTCTDCHDAHEILPPNDARSSVYPTNIAGTCAKCHENAEIMSRYGLSTDQIATHRASAHGVALYEKQNFAAPTCISCHGSHSALPPAVTEIANVCGNCHVLVRRAFDSGPHGAAARAAKLPGCTACHSNHGTESVRPDRIAATCTECHAEDTRAALLGIEIQQLATRGAEELRSAEEAMGELTRSGHRLGDVRLRYQTAVTAFNQLSQTQHGLNAEALEDLTRQVSSISTDIRASAEVAAESQWEHKLALVPIWFLALSAVVLTWFKLRGARKAGQ